MQAISEQTIHELVAAFYVRVRADPELGPIFDQAIGDGWDAHLATLDDFWSSVMLTSGRYKGNPVAVHQMVEGLRPELFARWLELFAETCRDLLRADIAAVFNAKAGRIADSLQRALFYRPELDVEERLP
ncbi:MAG: group III truncated hemoglobin [Devosia sp.]